MTCHFDHPFFGPTREASASEKQTIDALVTETPIAVFQAINKLLNSRGLKLIIDAIEEDPTKPSATEQFGRDL